MSEIKTMNEFLRDSKSSLSRRSLLLPKGQRLLAGAYRCCASYEGVYFEYFLDPDQGQTGPVSWEVAPLPPPRPVLTSAPFSLSVLAVSRQQRGRPRNRQIDQIAGKLALQYQCACVKGRQHGALSLRNHKLFFDNRI